MSLLEALLLAVVQGLTEFLPVSSSGHLVVADALMGSPLRSADREAFFVLLHFASAAAVLVWFARDLVTLLRRDDRWRTVAAIVIGCVPAGVAAVSLKLLGTEGLFDTPWIAGVGWIACGAFLLYAGRPRGATSQRTTWRVFERAGRLPVRLLLVIGLAQAAALVPGVSRSGSTIAMAVLVGMEKDEAFRYSFLMALILIPGAQLFELEALGGLSATAGAGTLASAAAVCFLVSLGALGILRYFVKVSRLYWFAPYCLLAGAVTLVLVATGHL